MALFGTVNIEPLPTTNTTNNMAVAVVPSIPMTLPIVPLPLSGLCGAPLLPSLSPSSPNLIQIELDQKTKQIQLLETAYWSLKADFDRVCEVVQSMKNIAPRATDVPTATNQNANQNPNPKSKLETIKEDEVDAMTKKLEEIETLKSRNNALEIEVKMLREKNHQMKEDTKLKNRAINKRNNLLEKEVKNMKHKMKRIERENRKLANFNSIEENKRNVKQNTLNELYLNANRIKEFMNGIKQYGAHYQRLKKRQINLTKCVGKEDHETFKIRMNDLYSDIMDTEASYHKLYEALDVMKTESQGKELDLITKDKEYILLLEKEKLFSSSHLEEYVKKNQTLQNDLTDREMKLRQTQNEVAFVKQKLNRLQHTNGTLLQQLNGPVYHYNPSQY
eukprot:967894_1